MDRSAAFTPLHRRSCQRHRHHRGTRALGRLKRPKVRDPIRVLAALGWSLLLPLAMRAEDLPQWRGPNRDGVWNETGILESFPRDGLKVRWRKPVGLGWSSPVVAQGRVFLTDAQLLKPSAKERLHCFEETTGELLWKRDQPGGLDATDKRMVGSWSNATPAISDGQIFLRTDAHLYCIAEE